jgi:hypothetical protein
MMAQPASQQPPADTRTESNSTSVRQSFISTLGRKQKEENVVRKAIDEGDLSQVMWPKAQTLGTVVQLNFLL